MIFLFYFDLNEVKAREIEINISGPGGTRYGVRGTGYVRSLAFHLRLHKSPTCSYFLTFLFLLPP